MIRALKILNDLLKDGWKYNGYDMLELSESEIKEDPTIDQECQHLTLTLSLKKKGKPNE